MSPPRWGNATPEGSLITGLHAGALLEFVLSAMFLASRAIVVVGIGDECCPTHPGSSIQMAHRALAKQGCVILVMVAVSMLLSPQRFTPGAESVNAPLWVGWGPSSEAGGYNLDRPVDTTAPPTLLSDY